MDENERKAWWKEIYSIWNRICLFQFPELSEAVKIEKVNNKYNNSANDHLKYIWVPNDEIKFCLEAPSRYLFHNETTMKGAMKTLEHLTDAKEDSELLAAIWIFSFTKHLLHELRNEAEINKCEIKKINKSAQLVLCKKEIFWSAPMKCLLPEMCISNRLIEALETLNKSIVLELNALSISYILKKYSIVEIDLSTEYKSAWLKITNALSPV